MYVKRLGLVEALLDDGVVIFEEDLDKVENILKNNPDLITDVIKMHEFARNNNLVAVEHIYPTQDNKLVYELGTYSARDALFLSMDIDALVIRSGNLILGITYPLEEGKDEGD
jgi:hypothetical protein